MSVLAPLPEPPSFADPPDYVDNITDEEILAGTNLVRPSDKDFDAHCLIVWGIPIVGPERIEKLKTVLQKLFAIKDFQVVSTFYPVDDSGKTKGYCFVEYESAEIANEAFKVIDNLPLDKSHLLSAYILSEMGSLKPPEKDWKPPVAKEYVGAGDLWWWLQNPKANDQFAIQTGHHGDIQLSVFWCPKGQSAELLEEYGNRSNWTEFVFKWSPSGTYLATTHSQGVCLWAGVKFERVERIHHPGVVYIEFSPQETYIVTLARADHLGQPYDSLIRISNTFTGELKKEFPHTASDGTAEWPFIKWSHDEKFFAFCRPGTDAISVFNTETFTVDNRISLQGLVTFEWNPTNNTIAYYCEERLDSHAPAEIGVIAYPSKERIRAQRVFSVSAAALYWQKNGDYFAAKTERYSSRKIKDNEIKLSGQTYHLEVFDCTGKDISVQTFQLPEQLISFAWEPRGDKFAVLVGSGNKVTPLVYKVDPDKPVPLLISKIESGVQLLHLKWAPQGSWLVAYSNNSSIGQAMFIDASGAEAVRSRVIEHPSMNYGEWDPTGRYFVTASVGTARFESGYRIYSFQGRELFKATFDGLTRFKWRPRPYVALSDEKTRDIRRNIKNYASKFEEEDRKEQQKASKELIEKRRKIMEEFEVVRQAAKARWEEDRNERVALRNGLDTAAPYLESELVDETITIPLSTSIKKLPNENADNDIDERD